MDRKRTSWRAVVAQAICVSVGLAVGPTLAVAQQLPSGGSVTAGTASIGAPQGGTLNINQSSDRAIINWQSYSIGQGGTVHYNQPGASSATLNRVTGNTPSSIAGTITAPGTVLLVNPNGIAITKSGVINTGSFAASTLDIKDSDFMSGNYKFTGNGNSAAVTNAGRINVSDGGFAALLGGQVANDGYITAKLGHVALGSGELVTLDLAGDGFLSVAVPTKDLGQLKGADGKPLVSNTGQIVADGGVVALKAATAAGILSDAVNVPGSIQANSVGLRNGKIVLGGGAGGHVRVAGVLTAQGSDGASGGTVNVRGAEIDLTGKVDVSAAGKGTHGGDVSVIADDTTNFSGLIIAEGGEGGSGGFVETSGHTLEIGGGTVDAGVGGQWLLDPYDLTVDASAASTIDASLGTGTSVTLQTTALGSSGPGTPNASGNGDIIIDSAIDWSTGATLTLDAYRDVAVNADITATSGGLIINAANAVSATGAIDVGQFTLQSGAWSQNSATLPSFAATSFTINGGSFLRVAGGDGSSTPYQITDVYGLQGINSSWALLSANYELANDIDASGTSGWNSGKGFVPLGTGSAGTISNLGNGFTGVFDGLNHTVSNLNVAIGSYSHAGLFAASSGTIRNIGVVGGSISGVQSVGGLVGLNFGSITNSYSTAATDGGAYVADYIGGLVGDNRGSITESYATGTVSGGVYVGGLAGINNGSITNAYATGTVTGTGSSVGGLAGSNFSGTITNAYATGAVSGTSTRIGGLVGWNTGIVTNGYWDTETTGYTTSDGSSSANGLTTAALAAALPTGFSSSVWGNANNQTTPYLLNLSGPVFIGSDSTHLFWVIQTLNELQAVNTGLTRNYVLGNTIDASATSSWNSGAGFVPLGTDGAGNVQNSANGFSGIFDGLGFTIDNLTINRPSSDFVGLFGYTTGATISNIGLIGGSVTGLGDVGDLVGSQQNSTISGAYATGTVIGGDHSSYVGGLVGYSDADSTISDSHATGAVSVGDNGTHVGGLLGKNEGIISDAYATGDVSGGSDSSFIGGLVGYNEGAIGDAHATGNVSGGYNSSFVGGLVGENDYLIIDAHATGAVSGGGAVGGLVGLNDGAIAYSYATGNISGNGYSNFLPLISSSGSVFIGGLVGLNLDSGCICGLSGTISDVYATGNVNGGSASTFVGGLVGENEGTIGDAYATGDVSGGSGSAIIGGLVGGNQALAALFGGPVVGSITISQAYATGNVSGGNDSFAVGGLVGDNEGAISDVYARGTVSVGDDGAYVGGLVGGNGFFAASSSGSPASISQAYATGAVSAGSGSTDFGGLAGDNGGSITLGYYDSTTTGQAHGTQADGSVGLTTLEWLTQGPVATNQFDTTATGPWVAGYPYPVLAAMPYVLITADGTEVYNSGTVDVTITSITDQNGNDASGLVGNTAGISWFTSASTNSAVGDYVLGGTGATGSAGYQLTYIGTLAVTPASSNTNTNPSNTNTYSASQYDSSGGGNGNGTPTPVTITFQQNSTAPVTLTTFTPPANQNIAPGAGGPESLYPPISQFDKNQYSNDTLPGFAPQAGEATVLTMIARAEENNRQSPTINALWNGNAADWPSNDNVLKNVSFSDGNGHTRTPDGDNGFAFADGSTDIAALLQHGPVMLGGASAGQPPTTPWLLAIKMTDDGKGILADDPTTGEQVVLAYDPATKTVGGVTAVIDPKTGKPVPLGNGAPTLGGQNGQTPASAWEELKAFRPASFFAVSI